jgi:hypothetical protein
MARKSKKEMLDTLRQMLADAFHLREAGVAYPRLARVHGYADGYMRALLELGVADQRELLRLVAEERQRTLGDATREVEPEDISAVA